jgi:hypothetical protein
LGITNFYHAKRNYGKNYKISKKAIPKEMAFLLGSYTLTTFFISPEAFDFELLNPYRV